MENCGTTKTKAEKYDQESILKGRESDYAFDPSYSRLILHPSGVVSVNVEAHCDNEQEEDNPKQENQTEDGPSTKQTPEDLLVSLDPTIAVTYEAKHSDMRLVETSKMTESKHIPKSTYKRFNKNTYKCHNFSRLFPTKPYFSQLYQSQCAENNQSLYRCVQCKLMFTSKFHFKVHLKAHKNLRLKSFCNEQGTDSLSRGFNGTSHICGKYFMYKRKYWSHSSHLMRPNFYFCEMSGTSINHTSDITNNIEEIHTDHDKTFPSIVVDLIAKVTIEGSITITDANMADIILKFNSDTSTAFAHCISADFGEERHMSAGVAVIFGSHFGKPMASNLVSSHLAYQKVEGGAGVLALVTKPKYFMKPTSDDYDTAFQQLTDNFKRGGYTQLICSPLGCTRDQIYLEHFLFNLVQFQHCTGASINIVSQDENCHRQLRNGLHHGVFLGQMRNITNQLQNLNIDHLPPKVFYSIVTDAGSITIIDASMADMISKFYADKSTVFAHCVSLDFGNKRLISKGVTLIFERQFGKPKASNLLSSHLAFQKVDGAAGAYALVTKPNYYMKPRSCDYDIAFQQLIKDFNRNGYKQLICSPLGCVRDRIPLEHFLLNLFQFQRCTRASVIIVSQNEHSVKQLRNGLDHNMFLGQMRDIINHLHHSNNDKLLRDNDDSLQD